MGTATKTEKPEPGLSSPTSSPSRNPNINDTGLDEFGYDNDVEGPSSFYSPPTAAVKKKPCCPCLNKSVVGLKALLFLFYGGIGVVATWLNHVFISQRFSEKECLLVYGLSSILSLFTPFVFGLISDKSAQPKKVLAVCLLLAGLLSPLILTVPPAAPHDYRSRFERCTGPNKYNNDSFCLPAKFNCRTNFSELVSHSGGCSEGCGGKLVLTDCVFDCVGTPPDVEDYSEASSQSQSTTSASIDEYEDSLQPQAQRQDRYPYDTGVEDDDSSPDFEGPYHPTWPPHICAASQHTSKFADLPLCYAFDKEKMKNITVTATDISGHTDFDGKCHYPLLQYSERLRRFQHLLYCSPLSPNCQVSCHLHWDGNESDQWSCNSDFIQWAITLGSCVAVHTLGTMLVISTAGLLNAAILSMSHEHDGYFGCQLTYATLGYAVFTPLTAYLFQYLKEFQIPWSLDYIAFYAIWLLLSALLTITMPYHAEWVPKPGTVRPTLCRWFCRGHTKMFFLILVILGAFQGIVDGVGFIQTKYAGATLLQFGISGAAAMIPALIFIYRVEKVIEYCGYHNVLAIALVVLSLQFTGYAYLKDVVPEWCYLLKALDTFSIVTVWAAAAQTTYNAAPRSLVGTCQAIIVILYCCIGRGIGCCLAYVALIFTSREIVLKVSAVLSVIVCLFYLLFYYCLLKPNPYSRQYDLDHGFSPSGKYTPLKILKGKKGEKQSQLAHTASQES